MMKGFLILILVTNLVVLGYPLKVDLEKIKTCLPEVERDAAKGIKFTEELTDFDTILMRMNPTLRTEGISLTELFVSGRANLGFYTLGDMKVAKLKQVLPQCYQLLDNMRILMSRAECGPNFFPEQISSYSSYVSYMKDYPTVYAAIGYVQACMLL